MATDTDLAYLAGLIDGEGYIGVKRSRDSFSARIQVRMVDEPAIAFLAATLGGTYYREREHAANRRPLYCFQASDLKAETILRAVLPYLRVKREQANTVLAFRAHQSTSREHRTRVTGYRNFPNAYGTPRQVPNLSLSTEYLDECSRFWAECKALNRVGVR